VARPNAILAFAAKRQVVIQTEKRHENEGGADPPPRSQGWQEAVRRLLRPPQSLADSF
jgi:hypothetical protein